MDRDLALYVVRYYSALMTPEERLAALRLIVTFHQTRGRSDIAAQEEVRRKGGTLAQRMSDDPAVLQLASAGLDAFHERVATRILAEHRDDVFLNYCPRCGGLTRTPKAKLCLHCGHSWHHESAG